MKSDSREKPFAFFLLVLLHLLFYRSIFGGGLLFGSDAILHYYPLREFARQAFEATGHFPHWNPYHYSGIPYSATFNSAAFYPFTQLLRWLSTHTFINLLFFVHSLLASFFTFLTFRRLSLHFFASLAGAISFSFGGMMTMRLFSGHCDAFATIALAPLIAYVWLRYIQSKQRIYLLLAGVALGLQILAGYPQYVYLTHLLLLPVVFLHLQTSMLKRLSCIALYLLVGLGVSAIQWLPALYVLKDSFRANELNWSYLMQHSYDLRQLLTLVIPNVFGTSLDGSPYTGTPFIFETSAYLGVTTLPFLYWVHWRTRTNIVLGAAFFLIVLLAMGSTFPGFYKSFATIIPLQKIFRVPGRFMTIGAMIYIYLFVQGLSNFFRCSRLATRFGHVVAVLLTALFIGDYYFSNARYYGTTALNRFSKPSFDFGNDRVFSSDRNFYLTSQSPIHGMRNLSGDNPMIPRRYNDFLNVMEGTSLDHVRQYYKPTTFCPMMSMAGVRWVISDRPSSSFETLLPHKDIGQYRIFENREAWPRAFFASSVVQVDGRLETLGLIQKHWRELRHVAVAQKKFGPVAKPPTLPTWKTDLPNHLSWEFPPTKNETFFVVSDTYYEGWEATGNGMGLNVVPVNGHMRGVLLPAGTSHVEMRYVPRGLAGGRLLSIMTLVFICGALFWPSRKEA